MRRLASTSAVLEGSAEALFRALLEAAPDALVIVSADGAMQLVNAQTERLFGYHRDELIGQLVEMLVPEAFRSRHPKLRDGYMAEPHVRVMGADLELAGRRKDGSEFPIEISLSPLDTPDGLVVSASIRDVTDRQHTEERWQTILESALDGFAVLRAVRDGTAIVDFEWLYINEEGARSYQIPAVELVGARLLDVFPGTTARGWFAELCELVETGTPIERLAVPSEEASVQGLFDTRVWKLGDGYVFTWRDVSERLRATASLRESEHRYRVLVESLHDALSVFTAQRDESGNIVDFRWDYANEAAAAVTGHASHDLVGRRLCEVLPDHGPSGMLDVYRRLVETGVEWNDPDLWYEDVWGDGRRKRRCFDVRATKLLDGFVVLTREVTAQREQDGALARSNAELEQFAYVASHDLQEPLRHIASFVQKLGERYSDVVDERGQRYISYVIDGATRMQLLIDGLLEFSRVGRAQARLDPIDLNALVAVAIRALSVSAEERSVTIESSNLPGVLGDEDLLYRLFVNLVSNAIKFSRPDRSARVEISGRLVAPGRCEIVVSDNGIGIEPAYREQAFDIFERLNGNDYPGTGIGLAVARRIMEAHGGLIELNDGAEGGAAVTLTFTADGAGTGTGR